MNPETFSKRLLDWYHRHGRHDLPWQRNITPYRVWVSEIMLQQTQVSTVIPFYRRFMRRFPNLKSLAEASLDEVLHYWTGLGYYARARNLHRAAGIIRKTCHGRFPSDPETLMALPGIGRSTAGAILSLAKNQRHAILDGNVKRVLARYHAIEQWPGKPEVTQQLWELAERYTPRRHVAAYTQAIMDLGATLCTRGQPDCNRCPVKPGCAAHARGLETLLPTARPGKALPVKSTHLLMLQDEDGRILLEHRPPSGLWGGLWSFPEYHTNHIASLRQHCLATFDCRLTKKTVWPEFRHTFSHFHLNITPVHLHVTGAGRQVRDSQNLFWYDTRKPARRGLAAPVRKLIDQLGDQHT